MSMSLWGIRKVESLDVTFASVLPSIRQVCESQHEFALWLSSFELLHFLLLNEVNDEGNSFGACQYVLLSPNVFHFIPEIPSI